MDEIETNELEQDLNTETEISIEDIEREALEVDTEEEIQEEVEVEGELEEQPAFQANYKYKIKDKEMEFDEAFRPFVTSPELEAKFREFHEKAYGIDEVKKHRDEIRQSYETYRQNFDPVLRTVQTAQQHYQRKNLDGVFEALGVGKEDVMEWARREHALGTLSPEAKAEYDRHRQREREVFQFQQEAEYNREQLIQLRREAKISEINTALSSPDAIGLQDAFDAKLGQGAFRRELIRRGQLHQAQTGQEKSAQEMVNEMSVMFGHLRQTQVQAQVQTPAKATAPKQAGAPLKKQVPVIPVTKSNGSSSVRRTIKSIDDMIKERDEL